MLIVIVLTVGVYVIFCDCFFCLCLCHILWVVKGDNLGLLLWYDFFWVVLSGKYNICGGWCV